MSTKTYHAYDITPLKTMDKIFSLVMSLKKRCFDEHVEICKTTDLENYIAYVKDNIKSIETSFDLNLDRRTIISHDPTKKVNVLELCSLLNYTIKQGYNDPINIYTSVVIIPHKKRTVLIPFGFSKHNLKYLGKKFKHYGYWNNTDKPNNVTDKEWNERKRFYDELESRGSTFSDFGLSYDLHRPYQVAHEVLKDK